MSLSARSRTGALIGCAEILARFVLCALRVVVGQQRLPIFVVSALALAGEVVNLPKLDMAPHLGPLRFAIAVQRFAISIRRSLIVPLQIENLSHAVMRQRTVVV